MATVPHEPSPSESFGGQWHFRWLEHARWVAWAYPSSTTRKRRTIEAITAGWSDPLRARGERALRVMFEALWPPRFDGLAEYLRALRRERPVPALRLLELWAWAHDAAHRHLSVNPLVHALDAMEWTQPPMDLVDGVIEVALRVRAQSDVMSTRESLPMVEPEAAEEPEPPAEPEVIELVHGYRESAGELVEKRALHAVTELAAVAEQVGGFSPSIAWRSELARLRPKRPGTCRIRELPRYAMEVLERMPRDAPGCFVLYNAIADTSPRELVPAVEHATTVFLRAIGRPELLAEAKLRAAFRRMYGSPTEEAVELGLEAFSAMSARGDRDAACAAACLVGERLGLLGEPDAAEWLERAWQLGHEHERPTLLAELLVELRYAHAFHGSEIGVRRASDRAAALSRATGSPNRIEEIEQLIQAQEKKEEEAAQAEAEANAHRTTTEASLRARGWPATLVTAEILLERGRAPEGQQMLNDYIEQQFDGLSEQEVVTKLERLLMRPSAPPRVSVELLEALCELLEDDHPRWREHKQRQLDIEDALANPQRMLCTKEGCALVPDVPYRYRVRYCVAAAEQALQQGRADEARFWVAQAERYRSPDWRRKGD